MKQPQQPSASAAGLDQTMLRNLDNRVQKYIDDGDVFGTSIIVARGGVIGHRKTFGNVAPGRAAASDDVYLYMSMTKSMTASLVLRAIDQGRFTLDTRVAEILPGFGVHGKQRATIRMLLTHTGGTLAALAPPPGLTLADIGNLEKYTAAVSALPAAFAPGTRVCYNSFAGYNLLGRILAVTDPKGRPYREIMRQDLFEPLGMSDTRVGAPKDDPRLVPISWTDKYRSPANEVARAVLTVPMGDGNEVPAGNIYGTVDDAFRFADTLRARGSNGSHRLVSQSLLSYATQNHTGDMTNDATDFLAEAMDMERHRPNFTMLGGYARGSGHFMSPMGHTASDRAFCSVGGASTMWMVDPARDLTFVFLSAGFLEGLAHFHRLSVLSDLVLAACVD